MLEVGRGRRSEPRSSSRTCAGSNSRGMAASFARRRWSRPTSSSMADRLGPPMTFAPRPSFGHTLPSRCSSSRQSCCRCPKICASSVPYCVADGCFELALFVLDAQHARSAPVPSVCDTLARKTCRKWDRRGGPVEAAFAQRGRRRADRASRRRGSDRACGSCAPTCCRDFWRPRIFRRLYASASAAGASVTVGAPRLRGARRRDDERRAIGAPRQGLGRAPRGAKVIDKRDAEGGIGGRAVARARRAARVQPRVGRRAGLRAAR